MSLVGAMGVVGVVGVVLPRDVPAGVGARLGGGREQVPVVTQPVVDAQLARHPVVARVQPGEQHGDAAALEPGGRVRAGSGTPIGVVSLPRSQASYLKTTQVAHFFKSCSVPGQPGCELDPVEDNGGPGG